MHAVPCTPTVIPNKVNCVDLFKSHPESWLQMFPGCSSEVGQINYSQLRWNELWKTGNRHVAATALKSWNSKLGRCQNWTVSNSEHVGMGCERFVAENAEFSWDIVTNSQFLNTYWLLTLSNTDQVTLATKAEHPETMLILLSSWEV